MHCLLELVWKDPAGIVDYKNSNIAAQIWLDNSCLNTR
jgi:hypothetical protein